MTTKITASVIEPLLTLALTNRTVDRMNNGEDFNSIEIATNDTFIDYVCSLGGLDPLSLGTDRKNGINSQVIYAERTLRRKGVCRKCGRGRYGLAVAPTDGVTVEPKQDKPQEVKPQAENLVEKEEPQVNTLAKSDTLGGLLYDRPSSFPSVGIFSDQHFRNIAIQNSKCFGRWSGSSRSACTTCPLAQFCFEKQNLDLEAFAVKYNERVQAQSSGTATKPSASTPKGSTKASKGKSAKATIDPQTMSKARRISARLEATCAHCGEKITVGSDTIWVPGGGTYHADCVE